MIQAAHQLILTWVSGSWKTTVMKGLLNTYPEMYAKPLQFTTRKPRSDLEMDEYVFLTHQQFMKKLINWDFIEYVEYNKELYAVWKYFDAKKTNIFIAEPVWREALKKYFRLHNIPFVSAYIEVDTKSIRDRLELRGSSVNEVDTRMKDLKYFYAWGDDYIVDWDYKPPAVLLDIHKLVKWASKKT